MKVRCVRLPVAVDGVRPVPSPWLTVDREYTVVSVLAEFGGRVQLQLVTDDDPTLGWFDSDCFRTVDPEVPRTWSARVGDGGTLELAPGDWLAEGFWERFYDGDPVARDSVDRELAVLVPRTP